MANYHFEAKLIGRGNKRSIAKVLNYITGEKLRDNYYGKTYSKRRQDILCVGIHQPENAPSNFFDLQTLCDEINKSEGRYDSQMAREFKCSLGNEFSLTEQVEQVIEYITENFIAFRRCAIIAIHEGKHPDDPSKNNPHVHIVVPFRTVELDGFSKAKTASCKMNNIETLVTWREKWAEVQNRAYERNGLDIRVSHESLEVQGINREPTIHISRIDWEKEKKANAHLLVIISVPPKPGTSLANKKSVNIH